MATPINGNHQLGALELGYAQALLELSDEASQFDAIAEEMLQLGELHDAEPDLGRLIDSRVISTADRRAIIERLFSGKVSDLTYRFLMVLNDKDRLSLLPKIARAYMQLVNNRRGHVNVDAYVATALSDDQASAVASGIGNAIGKTVTLLQHVDASLIGGLKIQIGDRLIDGSVSAQLRKIQSSMIEKGREMARAAVS